MMGKGRARQLTFNIAANEPPLSLPSPSIDLCRRVTAAGTS